MQGKPLVIALAAAIGIGMVTQTLAQNRPSRDGANGPRGSRSAEAVLERLDTDGDGVISLSEFLDAKLARVETRFDARDENGDGLITEDEVGRDGEPPADFDREAFRECVEEQLGIELPEPPAPGERFDEVDANGDGAIDLDEALAHATDNATDRFDALDDNADGVVDLDELTAAQNGLRALREARRTCREQMQDVEELLGG